MAAKKWVYLFNEVEQAEKYVKGDWDSVRGLLGGKGANLAEMTRIKLPVPPFFTVTTEACNAYSGHRILSPKVCGPRLMKSLKKVEAASGKKFGIRQQSVVGFLPFRRKILHARYDGHRPEHRFE